MSVTVDRGPAPVKSITLYSGHGGHHEPGRKIIVTRLSRAAIFTLCAEQPFGIGNVEVAISEALYFANCLKEMFS